MTRTKRFAPPPRATTAMCEPLEGRRLLTTTTLLEWSGRDVTNTSETWTAAANVPHTHVRAEYHVFPNSHGLYGVPDGEEGTNRPSVTLDLAGQTVHNAELGWQYIDDTGSWRLVGEGGYTHPNATSEGATLPHLGSSVSFTASSGGWTYNEYDSVWVDARLHALTPDVSVYASDWSATEGGADGSDTATLTFYRNGAPPDVPLTVNYTLGGSASSSDYTGPTGTVTFAPFEVTKDVVVEAVEDFIDDPDEVLTATVQDGPNYFAQGGPATVALQNVTYTFAFDKNLWSTTATATAGTAIPITGMLLGNGVAVPNKTVTFRLGMTSVFGDAVTGATWTLATVGTPSHYAGTFTPGASPASRQPSIEAVYNGVEVGSSSVQVN